jgi:hypothetical protein
VASIAAARAAPTLNSMTGEEAAQLGLERRTANSQPIVHVIDWVSISYRTAEVRKWHVPSVRPAARVCPEVGVKLKIACRGRELQQLKADRPPAMRWLIA